MADLEPSLGILIVAFGLLLFFAAWRLVRQRGNRRVGAAFLFLVSLIILLAGGYWTWFTHRRQPAPLRQEWFQGITYERVTEID